MLIGHIGIEVSRSGRGVPVRYHMTQLHPRKELMKQLGASHADKMYIDQKGKPTHVGYIIAGHWIHVYEVHSWTGGKK